MLFVFTDVYVWVGVGMGVAESISATTCEVMINQSCDPKGT